MGWLTVQDIVSRAGTSVGSFYARFSGKDDLFAYVEASVWTRGGNGGTSRSRAGSDRLPHWRIASERWCSCCWRPKRISPCDA